MFLLTLTTQGQTRSFLKNFKSATLPICVEYSHDEQVYFGAIYRTDTTVIHENDTTYTEIEEIYEEKNMRKTLSFF